MKKKINWELEFDKFLLENKAFDEFYMERCYYCIFYYNIFQSNSFNSTIYVKKLNPIVFILNAFYFYNTIKGSAYWEKLNNKWLKKFEEINKQL